VEGQGGGVEPNAAESIDQHAGKETVVLRDFAGKLYLNIFTPDLSERCLSDRLLKHRRIQMKGLLVHDFL